MQKFDEVAFRKIARAPGTGKTEWLLRAEDSIAFLKGNAHRDEIVIYATSDAVLIHGVLARTEKVTPADQADLLNAYVLPDESWCIQRAWGGGKGHRIYLEPPLSNSGCKTLKGGEKLIFRRSFTGVTEGPAPVEVSQKLVHCLDLYWVEERSAYCRLDKRGDIEDVIRVIWLKGPGTKERDVVVTILVKDLTTYMAVAGMSLVLKFDFTRFDPKAFGGWDQDRQVRKASAADLFYTLGVSANASYANGFMILRPNVTVKDLIQEWKDEENPRKKLYATFKIQDWKNKRLLEISCAPDFLSNYFEQSDKPFEVSPAFFRSEVLTRFKSDPEKYDLQDRSISCRNAWHLETYDINEVGQVHTYIVYLARLPYEEQCYWQSFNEWPKAPISTRAYENDFLGAFSSEYDPLRAIKNKIHQLDENPPIWWNSRGEDLLNAARYPATDSVSEWGDEILALDQLLNEGFLPKPLQSLLENLGRKVDKQWKSIRLLQDYLEAHGRSTDEARTIMEPLARLHGLRNPLKGHGSTNERKAAQKQARSEHGTLRAHYTALAAGCDNALETTLKAFGFGDTTL
ncbi:hypothetical protein [Geothrix sp. 21YS21S-2]|uniref:hypothetical protein n=1 Tax=Geothrix sp. 21YS21S-2 TaxID=3068893 RepID=UPI0027B9F575|nr:hypothetical protein [Geothrix sp. 21YS21S-2]